jgi:hypothetical protein
METASLQLDYIASDQLRVQSADWWCGVLGVVGFEKAPSIDRAQVPVTASMTPALGLTDQLCEVWRVAGAGDVELSTGSLQQGRARFRYCDDLLFGSLTIDEEPKGGNAAAVLHHATTTA